MFFGVDELVPFSGLAIGADFVVGSTLQLHGAYLSPISPKNRKGRSTGGKGRMISGR